MAKQVCPYCGHPDTLSVYSAQLPTILSACPKDLLSRATPAPFEVSLCKACSLGFNSKPLSQKNLNFLYDNYLYISPLRGIGTQKYTGMMNTLKDHCSPGDRIVEIGCSEGYLLKQLKDGGFKNLLGIEPGPQAATAMDLGLDIRQTYFDHATCDPQSVDCFYLMHVFEHFPDPFTILDHMVDQLSPGGKIIIEVPNACGFYHHHLFYYNETFLEQMARKRGLTPISSRATKEILRVVWQKNPAPGAKAPAPFAPPLTKKILSPMVQRCRAVDATLDRVNQVLSARRGKSVHWWGCGSAAVIYISRLAPALVAEVDFILMDGDKNRQGYFLPGVDAQVTHPDTIHRDMIQRNPAKHLPMDCLIIASSFHQEIIGAVEDYGFTPKETIIIEDFI